MMGECRRYKCEATTETNYSLKQMVKWFEDKGFHTIKIEVDDD